MQYIRVNKMFPAGKFCLIKTPRFYITFPTKLDFMESGFKWLLDLSSLVCINSEVFAVNLTPVLQNHENDN